MASVSVKADGFPRQAGGVAGTTGGTVARPGQKPAGGVAGKRQPVDEYIASLPAKAAFIGGKTLETLTSLPPAPQPKGQTANGINNNTGGAGVNNAGGAGIGINTIGRIGFNPIGGSGLGTGGLGGGTAGAVGVGPVNTVDAAADEDADDADTEEVDETGETAADETEADNAADTNKAGAELTPEEQGVVNELRNRDREVRAHEQAHISAGGAYIRGGASYQYQRGPDNKSYAVGGEVGIDAAPERDDPGATITKMQAVRAAALAPADPSAQDRAVAAAAARNESVARADLAEKEQPVAEEQDADARKTV